MSANEPSQEADWCEASASAIPTDSNPTDQTLRNPIVEFLQAASDGKLKAAELEVRAVRIVQAWADSEIKDKAAD